MSPEDLLIQTPLYFSVPRGLAYPDYTVFQCPQRSASYRLHCISVSPGVCLIQTTLYFSVPRGLTYPDYTVFQCPQRSDLSRLHCTSKVPHSLMCSAYSCDVLKHHVSPVLLNCYLIRGFYHHHGRLQISSSMTSCLLVVLLSYNLSPIIDN